MFQRGEYVVLPREGLCKIEAIEEKSFFGQTKECYAVVPQKKSVATLFITKETAEEKMRYPISYDEASNLVSELDEIHALEIQNEKTREDEYKNALGRGNAKDCLALLKCLEQRKRERYASNRLLTAVDDRYIRLVSTVVFSELSYVLGDTEIEKKVTERLICV